MYVATLNSFAPAEQTLYAETYTLFVSLQQIAASSMRLDNWDGPPSAETIVHMNRLVSMYLEEVAKMGIEVGDTAACS